jgi:hypothetical protein
MVAGIKKQHQDKVKKLSEEFLKTAAEVDDDGFGYAAITREGEIYGEKWLHKEHVFKIHAQPTAPAANVLIKDLLGDAAKPLHEAPTEKIYDEFGTKRTKDVLNNTVAVVVHARKKTYGSKSIENCHPFYNAAENHDPSVALIHNGSIMNHGSLTKKTSTCDSETILHEYLKNAMCHNPWAMPELAKTLVGQYTVGVLTSTFQGETPTPILDIFKSAKDLHVAYVKELDTYVFCTLPGLLFKCCQAVGLTPMGMSEVRDGYLIRIDAITGKRLEDLIPFDQSRQFLSGQSTTTADTSERGGTHHRPAGTHSRTAGLLNGNRDFVRKHRFGPQSHDDKDEDSIEVAREEFQKNHTDLFSAPYYDTDTGLSQEELVYFQTLEAGKSVDLKALRLVKKVLNF